MPSHRIWRLSAAAALILIGLFVSHSVGLDPVWGLALIGCGAAGGMAALPRRRQVAEARPAPEDTPEAAAVDHSALIDAIGDPLLIVRDRRVIGANRAATELLGAHIEGVDVRLAIRHPAAAQRLAEPDMRADRSGETPAVELVGLGELDRRWTMSVASLADDTRLVRLTDRSLAHAAEQMRVDFVANASHELRTPLATLIGFAETLQDDDTGDDRPTRHRFLQIMSDEARRMQQLIDDLISLSRIEAERFSPPRDAVPLLPLVQEVCESCAHLAGEKGSEIVIERGAADPVVPGDRAQLLQMIRNLVVNGLKYGRKGEKLLIRFDATADMVRMRIIDRGDGISSDHLPRLTERFYRVDPSRSRAMGGTGLGLAIVKHIVGRHRGRLDIDSILGEGTTVTVSLPAISAAPPPALS